MPIKKISSIYFSPTNSTYEVVSLIGTQINLPLTEINITEPQNNAEYSFNSEDFVIFGMPVYGGRIPAIAVERLQKLKGNQTAAIILVTYGNRDYDDALLELQQIVEKNGFIVSAAACIITEHSIMHSVAKGRPDKNDKEKIIAFAEQVFKKLEENQPIAFNQTIKGNQPFKEYNGIPLKPKASKKCTYCGICAKNCPVQAIPKEEPKTTCNDICISCMSCIKNCPAHARTLNKFLLFITEKIFYKKYHERREAEFFI